MIMKTHDADQIRRKAEVDQDDRTAARDDAARFVEEEIVDADEWRSSSLTEIADRSAQSNLEYVPDDGWSRQHIANTIEAYFEAVLDGGGTAEGIAEHEAQIPVPEDLDDSDVSAYVRGYLRAKKRYQ